jgi:hypothetical protein
VGGEEAAAIQYLEAAGFQVIEPTYSVSVVAKKLGLSNREVIALADSGELRTVNPNRQFHKWRRFPASAVHEFQATVGRT